MRALVLTFSDADEFLQQVSSQLRKARYFLPEASGFSERSACQLEVENPLTGRRVCFDAEVVFEDPSGTGLGVELSRRGLDAKLTELMAEAPDGPEDEALAIDASAGLKEEADKVPEAARVRNIHERIRKLPAAQRDRMARSGSLTERIALERAFGGSVWEALLQNPQLTGAEVARIAKNGTAPTPILAQIASNAAYLSRGEIRRALLGNPRLSPAHVDRVLKALPKNELKLVANQTAYPARVRMAARRFFQ